MAANLIIPQKPRNTSALATKIATPKNIQAGKTHEEPNKVQAAPKRKRRRKGSTFYKELKSSRLHPTSGSEIKNPWLIKREHLSLDQPPERLHPAALTLWIWGNMARKRDTQLTVAIKSLEALLEKEPHGGMQQSNLRKKTLRDLVKLREMNAKNDFVKGPLWRELESKLHKNGGLSFLVIMTGLLCLEKIRPQKEIRELQLSNAMKIVTLEAGYKEFVDTVCPTKASEFLNDFCTCGLWAGMGLASDDAVALNCITELMTSVVAETEDFPRNLGNDEDTKTFLHPDVIEAFTRETESGGDSHRELYKRRNEAARSFVLGFQRLEAMSPPKT